MSDSLLPRCLFFCEKVILTSVLYPDPLTSQGRGARVCLKQAVQWLVTPFLSSGQSIEHTGSSTQIISPAWTLTYFISEEIKSLENTYQII